jgi:hypothetical protein
MGGGELTDEQMNEYLATGTITRGATAQPAAATTGVKPVAEGQKPIEKPAIPALVTPQPTVTAQGPLAAPEEEPDEVEEGQFEIGEGQQFISTPEFGDLGYAGIIIRSPFSKPVTQETEKAFVSTTGRKGRSKATETSKKEFNVAESAKDLEDVSKIRKNYSRIQGNPDLKTIFEESGKNFGNILIDESGEGGAKIYTAKVTNPQTGEVMPDREITDTEYETLRFFKEDAPNFFKTRGVIPVRRKQEAPAAPAAGPAAATPTAAPTPIAETAELEKALGRITETETTQTAQQRKSEIDKINREIKALSGTEATVAGPSTAGTRGAEAKRPKTKREIENAIVKIKELVARRDALEGKQVQKIANPDPSKYRSGQIVEQGGVRYQIQ